MNTRRAVARTRSAVTLTVLAVLLIACVAWGWNAFTKPFPAREDAPACTDLVIPAGQSIFPDQVVVSVLNASERNGLANQTMKELIDLGFVRGETGDDQTVDVKAVQIWTTEPDNPAVELLRTHLGKRVAVKRADTSLPGINVLVGDGFKGAIQGLESVPTEADTTVCGPPGT